MTPQVLIAASRLGVSSTIPELECDIDAQLKLLMDPDHPKNAVFLCRGQPTPGWTIPNWIFVERRAEGTLITDSAALAATYRLADFVTDDLLAAILCYPEPKADAMESGDALVVQTIDKAGCVVFEAACSQGYVQATLDEAERQCPLGGHTAVISPQSALARRIAGMN